MLEKVPEFSAESLCLRQRMVTLLLYMSCTIIRARVRRNTSVKVLILIAKFLCHQDGNVNLSQQLC